MNTIEHQEHQVERQEENPLPLFFRIFHPIRPYISWCMEHKKLFALILIFLMGLISISVYSLEKSKKKNLYNLLKAEKIVQDLRNPFAKAQDEKATTPSYEEIKTSLSTSSTIQERFNGVLLEEGIIAKKEVQNDLLSKSPSPFQEWTWRETSLLAGILEKKDFTTALSSIQSILQEITKKEKDFQYRELVGYLRLMEEKCLTALNRSSSESSVEFEKWKKTNPDLAQKINQLCFLN